MDVVKLCHTYWHTGSHQQTFTEEITHAALSGNQRRLETHPKLHVLGCGLPTIHLVEESQKGHANVASPCRLLDDNRRRNPIPLTRHTRINQPAFTLTNFSQPNQDSPLSSLQRTTLNQVDEHLQGTSVKKVAAINHCACPLETAGLASPRVRSQIRHSNVGPLPWNMAILQ
jgi:hypothetical protein